MLKELLHKLKNNTISQRQFISIIKNNNELINIVNNETTFLNEYNANILERLYYIINDIHEVIKCKYCNTKLKFTGRLNKPYHSTCGSKECVAKELAKSHKGFKKISNNRDNEFIKWQQSISYIDDDIIKEKINYDKYVDLIDNEVIINYLKNRYKDSDSLLETVQRIKFDIEEKPKCPTCGKPVNWVGKKSKLYTTYCSNKCSGISSETINKKKQTQLEHWGTENCFDSEKYKNQYKEKYEVEYSTQRDITIENRKNTLLEHYGTTKLYDVEEIKNKTINTNREKFGYDSPFQSPEIRKKTYEICKENGKLGTSKSETLVYNYLIELGYNVERFYMSDKFPYCCDFYLKDYDVYLEFQGSQYHNYRSFLNTEEDKQEINELLEKHNKLIVNTNKTNTQYNSIIKTWTIYDVNKRNFALEHNINFLEIYQCNSKQQLKNQLDVYFYFFNKSDNIFKNNPIERRRIIQELCKKLNKKEYELTINNIKI